VEIFKGGWASVDDGTSGRQLTVACIVVNKWIDQCIRDNRAS
jgi:hypothetical protein